MPRAELARPGFPLTLSKLRFLCCGLPRWRFPGEGRPFQADVGAGFRVEEVCEINDVRVVLPRFDAESVETGTPVSSRHHQSRMPPNVVMTPELPPSGSVRAGLKNFARSSPHEL